MKIEQFAEKIKVELEKKYGSEYKITVNTIVKNNDTRLTGILIGNVKDSVFPTIYIDELFNAYRNNTLPLEEACSEVIKAYNNSIPDKDKINIGYEFLADFNNVKDKICIRLVNKEMNSEKLKEIPHLDFLDLACEFYVPMFDRSDDKRTLNILIKKEMIDLWNIDINDLFDIAKSNTRKIFKYFIIPMGQMIQSITDTDIDDIDKSIMEAMQEDNMMFVGANNFGINGATIIMFNDILKDFAEKVREDIYIIPSSIHEVILIPENSGITAKDIKSMINDVNGSCVLPEEVLSNNLYMYSRNLNEVIILK